MGLKIAYFTNQYPAVSHTFIRREIEALELLGTDVTRYALRSQQDELVDERDKREYHRTQIVQNVSKMSAVAAVMKTAMRHPLGTARALKCALRLGRRSDTGMMRHVIYAIEAMILTEWCKVDKIDHLHVHFGTNPAAISLMIKYISDMPFSITIHGFEEYYRSAYLSLDEKLEHAKFVVCVSSYGRGQLMRVVNPRYWKKIEVIHCGLDDTIFSSNMRGHVHSSRFVCVGRLCAEKAQLILVKAAGLLRDEEIECEVVFVGDGPMRLEIENAIVEANLSDRVFIRGWASGDQVLAEIGSARALVLPSFVENLPIVIMEGLALGKAVISTFVGGIPELVKEGKTGWLVPASDVVALAGAMKMVLSLSEAELDQVAVSGKAAVLAHHNASLEAARLNQLFMSR